MKIAIAALIAVAGGVSAQSITHMGSFGPADTDFTNTITIPGFDSMGGSRELTSIYVKLIGEVSGDAKGENLSTTAPDTITLELSAMISLDLPGFLTLAEVLPLADETFMAAIYDGVTDFDGPSGESFLGLNAMDMDSSEFFNPFILNQFIDVAFIDLEADASGQSKAVGGGNVASQFNTDASYSYEITYKYIPTPASAAVLGLGGLVATRRRR